jgi:hypothetical protein
VKQLILQMQGRFGNMATQWLFANAYAIRHGFELRCDPWVGERIFAIADGRPDISALEAIEVPVYNEAQLATYVPAHTFFFRGYAQNQSCMLYTKRQAQAWLKFRPEILDACSMILRPRVVAHLRRGDFAGYGFPLVSEQSYVDAAREFCIANPELIRFVSEETEECPASLPSDLSFVPDFLRMVNAKVLLRANSSFSWLAGLLGNGLVLSPVIDGLEGGREQHCRFVAGNHPRLSNFDFVSDLYVNP